MDDIVLINKYLFNPKFQPEWHKCRVSNSSAFIIRKEYFEFPYYNTDYQYTEDMFFRDAKKRKHYNPICRGVYCSLKEVQEAFTIEKKNIDKIRFFETHNGTVVTGEYIYIEFYDFYKYNIEEEKDEELESFGFNPYGAFPRAGILTYCISPNEE